MRFYFTFGTSPLFPYQVGWVEVIADNYEQASNKFRTRFPDRNDGLLNCAFSYSESFWKNTIMAESNNNMGASCHEVII